MFPLEEGTEAQSPVLSLLHEKLRSLSQRQVQPGFSTVKHEQQTRKDCILIQIFIISSHKLDQGIEGDSSIPIKPHLENKIMHFFSN